MSRAIVEKYIYMIKKSVLGLACGIVITYSLSIIFSEIRKTVKWQVLPNRSLLLRMEKQNVSNVRTHMYEIGKLIETRHLPEIEF
jgi:hypothetical protein